MPLITCRDCGATVSSKATACPSCGCPTASGLKPRSAGVVVTTEKTGKSLKLWTMVEKIARPFLLFSGCCLMMIGFVMSASMDKHGPDAINYVGRVLLVLGFLMAAFSYLWKRVLAYLVWWRHG